MLFHCLLASLASDEKLAITFIEETLYVIHNFSVIAFNIPSVFDLQQFHYDVSGINLNGLSYWSSLNLLDM